MTNPADLPPVEWRRHPANRVIADALHTTGCPYPSAMADLVLKGLATAGFVVALDDQEPRTIPLPTLDDSATPTSSILSVRACWAIATILITICVAAAVLMTIAGGH